MSGGPLNQTRETTISVRVTAEERQEMELAAKELGFRTLSDYLRFLHNNSTFAA